MSGSPSTSPPNLNILRKRAMTTELTMPQPENAPEKYTRTRVDQGLQYATQRIISKSRKPSPRTQTVLLLYRDACSSWLSEEKKGWKDDKRYHDTTHQLRRFEAAMGERNWISQIPKEWAQDLQNGLLAMRQQAYYARYGDWAKLHCLKLRNDAVPDAKTLLNKNQTWVEIWSCIQAESSDWICYELSQPQKCPYTNAVRITCGSTGMDFDQTLGAIQTYAKRNKYVNNSWIDLLKEEKYQDLQNLIFSDLNDLTSVIPVELVEEKTFMDAFLRNLITRWWESESEDFGSANGWNAKGRVLWEDRAETIKMDQKSKDGSIAAATAAAAAAANAVKRMWKRDELWEQSRTTFDESQGNLLESGPVLTPKKRKVRVEKVHVALFARDVVITMQSEINRVSGEYKPWYGGANAITPQQTAQSSPAGIQREPQSSSPARSSPTTPTKSPRKERVVKPRRGGAGPS